MLEEFKNDEMIKKVGGRFKLTALIQKRVVALNRGARPLVDLPTKNLMKVVVQEILQEKIYLDDSGDVAVAATEEAPDILAQLDDAGPSEEDM